MRLHEKIRAFIIDCFLFGEDRGLKDDSSFLEEGFIDSTGVMQLVAFLEEEFSVIIRDEELVPENLDSINRVAAFLDNKMYSAIENR
jgi:acyl carrier protein